MSGLGLIFKVDGPKEMSKRPKHQDEARAQKIVAVS